MPVVVPVTHNTTCGMTAAIGCAFFSYHLCDARFFSLFLGSFCYRCVNSFFLLSFFIFLPVCYIYHFIIITRIFVSSGRSAPYPTGKTWQFFPHLLPLPKTFLVKRTDIIVDATGPILFFPSTITIHLIGV